MLNWRQRYANRVVLNTCVFCSGPHHRLKSSARKKWKPEMSGISETGEAINMPTGRPRPFYIPSEEERKGPGSSGNRSTGIPYIRSELGEGETFPQTSNETFRHCIKNHKCTWCGEQLNPNDDAGRIVRAPSWREGRLPLDEFPMHRACMREVRSPIGCPALPKEGSHDEDFEYGKFSDLLSNWEAIHGPTENFN